MNPAPENKPVVVVGGGWAGIATAAELARYDIPVILLESAKQLGGRARNVQIDELQVDNGQHLLLGAYESTLDLLKKIGVDETDVVQRQPLSLHWHRSKGRPASLNTPGLPAPLHLAWGLLTMKGLSFRNRFSALRFSRAMEKNNFSLDEDCSVADLLARHRQSPVLIQTVWEPMCIGALNTHLHEASAQIFLRTLGESFRHTRRDSDLLLTKVNLGNLLPRPAADYIEANNGSVRLGQRVTALSIEDETISAVTINNNMNIEADDVVLATPHTISQRLVKPHTALQNTSKQLAQLRDRPICTVYLQFEKNVRLGRWLCGSLGTLTQWIFDRGQYGQPGLMAVVISGDGEHMGWDNTQLCEKVVAEIAVQFPHWPAPLSHHVIREKRATLASTVNVNQLRPDNKTAVNGLWLAGDYTNTELPATLEGAVRSGRQCAQRIIAARRNKSAATRASQSQDIT